MGAQVLLVMGAAGGVGASTLACLLARRRAASGQRVVLLDLDPGRGGLEVLLGIEQRPGVRWADMRHARGTVMPDDLVGVLPRWEGVEVLSADRQGGGALDPDMVRAVWPALVAGCATVVVDVSARAPAGLDPVVLAGADGSGVLVTGQDVLGVAGAVAARRRLEAVPRSAVHLVLRRRRGARVAPFEAARALDLPLLAAVPEDRSVAAATDRGFGPRVARRSRLARAVDRIDRGLRRAPGEPRG